MNNIFNGDDTVFTQGGFDDGVGGERDSLFVDLSVTSLVDEFSDSLKVRFTARDRTRL